MGKTNSRAKGKKLGLKCRLMHSAHGNDGVCKLAAEEGFLTELYMNTICDSSVIMHETCIAC